MPGKVIKLAFSTSPKILSPRFNSAPLYREDELSASEVKLLDAMVVLFLIWEVTCLVTTISNIPTNSIIKGSLSSTSLLTLAICCFLGESHPDSCEVVSHFGLICVSQMISDIGNLCVCWPSVWLLW